MSSRRTSFPVLAEDGHSNAETSPAGGAMPLKAEFNHSRKDLYWTVWGGEDGTIRWSGYDDANWWDRVSHTDHARRRVGQVTGRHFVLDHAKSEVTVFDGAPAAPAEPSAALADRLVMSALYEALKTANALLCRCERRLSYIEGLNRSGLQLHVQEFRQLRVAEAALAQAAELFRE